MDCICSRIFVWLSFLVVTLVVLSIVVYSVFKSPVVSDSEDEIKLIRTVSGYKPLEDEGFRRLTQWGEIQTHGPLSASAADFQKDDECRRVVVFLARGTILDHILTDCDSMEPSMGLLIVNDVLYYYGRAMGKQAPTENMFTVATKEVGQQKCFIMSYTVISDGDDRSKVVEKSESKEVTENEDTDCKLLIDFKMPPMLLLSTNSTTGMFAPGKTSAWATVNPWEPMGAVTRLYWYGTRCFRLLLITSYGRSIRAVKVSCGPVENVVVTQNALYYGDALVVRRNSEANTFFLVYNPKRSSNCFKETILLSIKEGRSVAFTTSIEHRRYEQDEECQNLVNGNISEAVITQLGVDEFVKKLKFNSFGVEPYGDNLSKYNPYSHWSYFNLPLDLGLAVTFYKEKESPTVRKLLMVVARGVPVAAVLTHTGPIERLVMRTDVLYHDKDIMLRKTEDEFTSLVKVNENNCFKESYVIRIKGEMIVKEEIPSRGKEKVAKDMDEDCMDLLEGRRLKNPEAGNFVYNTDDSGVPKDLPAGVNDPIDH